MSISPRSGAWKEVIFADTLSVLLPLREQIYLLKACLHSGDRGKHAWEVWQELAGDALAGLQSKDLSRRSLLPLLAHTLRNNQIEVDPKVRSYLHRVVLYEELRALAYQQILHQIVAIFSEGDINYLALKGAALSASVFTEWSLRHSHDIDILLHQKDQEKATTLLEAHNFKRISASGGLRTRSIKLVHDTGLPVGLHLDLFRIPYYQAPLEEIWARHTLVKINGMSLHTLSAADALLHVCGQATGSGSRDSLIWVSDAWHIVQSGRVDWDIFLATAFASRLELPLAIQFEFLKDKMQIRIPDNVLDCLISAAQASPRLAKEAALLGARTGHQGSVRNLLRQTHTWHAKATLLMWMLLPSLDTMRWTEDFRRGWTLPLLYIARPIRFIKRHLRRYIRLMFQRFRLRHPRSIPTIKR